MSIQKMFEFPLVTENFKIFFCDSVGPVLVIKQDKDNDFTIQFVFSYKGIRVDQATSWNTKAKKDGLRDPDKEEEKRDNAFDSIGQKYVDNFIEDIVETFFKGVIEETPENA